MSGKNENLSLTTAKKETSARRFVALETAVLHSDKIGGIVVPVRKRLARTPSRHWKQNLEKNLIKEGYTPTKARELVEIAAS
jgi:hypothetical protein